MDLTPTELAAKATPCAWLPAEEATDCVQVALGVALHDLVVRAAHLEGAGLLLVFILEVDLCAGHGGEGRGGGKRDVVDNVFQTFRRRFEIFQF